MQQQAGFDTERQKYMTQDKDYMLKTENKKKYVTLKNEGCDFRKMAKIMSTYGYKMNHATARNQLIIALEELVTAASSKMKIKHKKSEIFEIANSQQIQDNLSDILCAAYNKMQSTKKEKGNGKSHGKNEQK